MGYTRIKPELQASKSENLELKTDKNRYLLHSFLFLLTIISTIMAGAQWLGKDITEISNWQYGFTYSALIMLFISAHEFGHYFASKFHKVDSTLPFYLPMPFVFLMPFGTMGAVIRIRSAIPSRKALFDIGVAGPLAGFVVALAILIIGFVTLPTKEYLFQIHPEYRTLGGVIPNIGLHFGDTILFSFLANIFSNPHGWLPPMNEIYHYPFLCVGWFGLFVTSLNLLPLGQLDGGHVIYAMFGSKQSKIARYFWWVLIILGAGGFLGEFFAQIKYDSPNQIYTFFQQFFLSISDVIERYAPWYFTTWSGWIFWAFVTKFFIRLDHPPVSKDAPIGTIRMAIGWLTILIFVLSFCYNGIYIEEPNQNQQVPNVNSNDLVMVLP